MVKVGGDLQSGRLADRLLIGLGQPQPKPKYWCQGKKRGLRKKRTGYTKDVSCTDAQMQNAYGAKGTDAKSVRFTTQM